MPNQDPNRPQRVPGGGVMYQNAPGQPQRDFTKPGIQYTPESLAPPWSVTQGTRQSLDAAGNPTGPITPINEQRGNPPLGALQGSLMTPAFIAPPPGQPLLAGSEPSAAEAINARNATIKSLLDTGELPAPTPTPTPGAAQPKKGLDYFKSLFGLA